jgi:hypothetical protein
MRGRVGVGAALLVTPGVEKRDASSWMRHHARDCDWARVTGSGTRQRKREKDGFLFNSCYLHGTCVLSLPSLLPLIFSFSCRGRRRCAGRARGSMPMSMSKRRGTSEDPGVTGDD